MWADVINRSSRSSATDRAHCLENTCSKAVLEAQVSVLPTIRGRDCRCSITRLQYVDVAENLAINGLRDFFGCKFATFQPHSGASANAAAYALMSPGDTFMVPQPRPAAGHLTPGSPVNSRGAGSTPVSYGVRRDTPVSLRRGGQSCREHRPKGTSRRSPYPRFIDFLLFRNGRLGRRQNSWSTWLISPPRPPAEPIPVHFRMPHVRHIYRAQDSRFPRAVFVSPTTRLGT